MAVRQLRAALGRRGPTALAAATLLITVGVSVPSLASPTTPNAPAAGPSTAPDASTARRLAAGSAAPVEVLDNRTETSQLFANPDGTWTLVQHAVPVRTRQGRDWVAIDTTLHRQSDGTVSPRASTVDVRFSGGGADAPLVALAEQGRSLGLTWPRPLPVPSLSGDTATYADVLPGVDLRMTATADGFREVLVVKNRAAALNPALRQITFGLTTRGLTLRTQADGATIATDEAGRPVFVSPVPTMEDSPHRSTTRSRLPVEDSTAAAETEPPLRKPMGLELTATAVTVRPDLAMLTDPAARFPLLLDPDWSTPSAAWVHFNILSPDQRVWGWDQNDGGAKVGNAVGTSCCIYRSVFRFPISSLIHGATVSRARMHITLNHSPNCNSRRVLLSPTGGFDVNTTWRNFGGSWGGAIAEAWGAAWEPGSCQHPLPMEFDIGGHMQNAATGGWGEMNLGLWAADENDEISWKKYLPSTASISVTYNHAPDAPGQVTTVPPTPCGTAANPTPLNTTTPTLSSRLVDRNGDNLSSRLEIRTGSTVVYGVDGAAVVSGTVTSWPTVPAGRLPADQPTTVFTYQARATDVGGLSSGFSGACHFTVDTAVPGTPTVESTDFPNGEPVRSVGQVGTLTLSPGFGQTGLPDTDIGGYRYGFQQDKLTGWATADASGRATIPMVLWTTARTLYVQAVDRAGNPSVSEEPCICTVWDLRAVASSATPARKLNDVNGDGRADVSTMFDLGHGRTVGWTAVSRSSGGLYQPYLGFDTGINGGFPGYRTTHVTGDFTGDGLSDIAVFREDPDRRLRLFLLKSDSHRYDAGPAPLWEGPAASKWALSRIQPSATDADGDGKLDIVAVVAVGPAEFTLEVLRNTSSASTPSFAAPAVWWSNPAGWAEPARMRAVTGDFNGDGKGDLAHFYNYDSARTALWVHYSTGTSFNTGVMAWDGGVNNWDWWRGAYAAADVTGDGRADIVGMYDYGTFTHMWLWRGTATGFEAGIVWWDGFGAGTGFLHPRARFTTGDFNADGRADLAAIYDLSAATAAVHLFLTNATGTAAISPNFAGPVWAGAIGAVPANVTPEPGRVYRLIASHSNKCVDVAGASTADGALIQQYTCLEPGGNQKVTFEPVGGGPYYRIKFTHSGKCLDVAAYSRDAGGTLHQWSCHSDGNQQWRLEYLAGAGGDVQARIRVAHSDQCMGIAGGSQADGAQAVQWPCTGGPLTDHSYYIRVIT